MSANVESMFYVGRKTPWHGLGQSVEEAPDSKEALVLAGLDWKVRQEPIMTSTFVDVPGYQANIRTDTEQILGVVTDRYRIVQNEEAFAFTDALMDFGITYETAGSLAEGRRVWLLAKLPEQYRLAGEETESYVVFSNSHDGTAAIKVAITPVRVVCQNTLNLALQTAKRSWSMVHVGDVQQRLEEAKNTLFRANRYMEEMQKESERLSAVRLTDKKVMEFIDELIQMPEEASALQKNNIIRLRSDMVHRYFDAPDLKVLPKSGWRFINAVSDFATHAEPLRKTARYQENLFTRTVDGHPLIDKARGMVA